MADSADHSNPTERYSAIEQAYCADQWGEVIDQGQNLLREIPRSSAPVPVGLKERVQLLMAHAHLYGFNERDVAVELYSDVLHSNAELPLRQIAEQGLQHCALPKQVDPVVIAAGTEEGTSPGPAAAATAAAPSQAGSQHQTPASLQPDAGELSGTALVSQNLNVTADADRAAALDRVTALAPESPEAAAATPAAPSSAATGSMAMPWLATGAMAAPAAAAAPSASAPTPWATVVTELAPAEPAPSPEALKAAVEAQPGAATSEAFAPATQPSPPAEHPMDREVTLIPEVVDEPELFEVHQADPRLAEELDLTVMEPESPIAVTAAEIVELPSTSLSAAAAIASAAILGATAAPAAAAATPTPLAWPESQAIPAKLEPDSTPGNKQSTAPGKPQSLLSMPNAASDATKESDVLCELFRNPPVPVKEEDHELLLGLLQVLVSADSAGDGG